MEKGEIACTSNFAFSHNVFKRLFSQTHQNVSLCGNGFTFTSQSEYLKDVQKKGYNTNATFNDSERDGLRKHCGKRSK